MHLSWLHTVADALPKFLCPFCTLPPLLPVVGRGLVYCLRIAVFIPSAYLCPLFISLISLLSTFLEPSALPPHSLQCSEVDTEGKHTLNLQWPGSPCALCASSSSSAYSKPQLASPAHLMEFLVHFGFCTTPLPTNNVFPRSALLRNPRPWATTRTPTHPPRRLRGPHVVHPWGELPVLPRILSSLY